MQVWLARVVFSRRWLTFTTLCLSFLIFGLCTLNLVFSVRANVELIAEYGVMALEDGALQQFVELLASVVVGMACYILFKACEHVLVHGLTQPPHIEQDHEDRDPAR